MNEILALNRKTGKQENKREIFFPLSLTKLIIESYTELSKSIRDPLGFHRVRSYLSYKRISCLSFLFMPW